MQDTCTLYHHTVGLNVYQLLLRSTEPSPAHQQSTSSKLNDVRSPGGPRYVQQL